MQISRFNIYRWFIGGGLLIAVAIAIVTNTAMHGYTGGGRLTGHRSFPQPVAGTRRFLWYYHGLFYLCGTITVYMFLCLFQPEDIRCHR